MIILGIDLGSTGRKATKSFVTVLNTNTGEIERASCPTTTDALLGLLGAHRPVPPREFIQLPAADCIDVPACS
jgi:hypothetical protein